MSHGKVLRTPRRHMKARAWLLLQSLRPRGNLPSYDHSNSSSCSSAHRTLFSADEEEDAGDC
eukprot:CAMPEP_0173399608 /NCGR_PEP_ID=MMETSP1356-20130122/45475_1 /TAXON_ID=77927 ORGANISM="Hemiselmis virescens, Strain PCC157" /NCGR_SAMPLE_ID=MMETSP1356 /ASSEMBLY_ACC=CAM_ASM_000847 /LENGTH=61 /DNA_ID=CAMNT_0014359357 /DNA_START=76 /DNA_END=258 /DNA_ORIENTATION=-